MRYDDTDIDDPMRPAEGLVHGVILGAAIWAFVIATLILLFGCGAADKAGPGIASSQKAQQTPEAHTMTVSVMGLDEGPVIEAIKITIQLPEGMTADATSEGEIRLSGEGMLLMGSQHAQELCLVSLSPGGFKGGPDMFKFRVFGDPALASGIRVTYVHACGSVGMEIYEAPACSLAAVKCRLE